MCTKCLQWKPLDDFPRDKSRADGRYSRCSECQNAAMAEYRARFAEAPTYHSYTGYTHGCRCRICKDAKATYVRDRRKTAFLAAGFLEDSAAPVPGVTHGTRSAYEERGCRCPQCVAVKRGVWLADSRRRRAAS
jgi:hypothetical protein